MAMSLNAIGECIHISFEDLIRNKFREILTLIFSNRNPHTVDGLLKVVHCLSNSRFMLYCAHLIN
jgi:hypothetical protein